jgi:phosphoenolpyruvate carboxykinase (ATP)
MVLGQSVESSAGDPTRTGEKINKFFYDPFVAGNRSDHANLFYSILLDNPHINCYLLNTGGVGEGKKWYRKIKLEHTVEILDLVLRDALGDWVEFGNGLMAPRSAGTVDPILLHPEEVYPSRSDFEEKQKALFKHYAEILDMYPGLNKKVKAVFQS